LRELWEAVVLGERVGGAYAEFKFRFKLKFKLNLGFEVEG
jgi:hypothetical protein